MLSDEVVEKVTERLINRLEQANEYVLREIGKKIKYIGTLTPSKAQQLIQILKYGGDYEKIIKKLNEITNLNVKDIKKIFEEIAKNDYDFAKQFYDYRKKKYISFEQNKALQRQINALAKITSEKYIDIARTKALGFTIKNEKGKIIFKGLRQTYNEAIDKAVLSVVQGKSTFQEQMYSLLKNIGVSGLKTLDYNGRSIRLDSAVRMQMDDAIRQLHNETQRQFGKEFNSDGVEITVHENPAPDHEEVQGRQFSNEEFDKFQNDIDAVSYDGIEFPATSEETGYDRRSISEYNCKHFTFSIILGVNIPQYSNKELKQIIDKNNKGFMYEGKHYTMYEGTQLQRELERKVREQKDLQILGVESNNKELINKSQQNITKLTRKYKQLSEISKLKTKMQRMRVSNYKRKHV